MSLARGDNALTQNSKTAVGSWSIRSPGFRVCPGPVPGAQIMNVARTNMPREPVSDPQYWRAQAAKARAKADRATDDVTRHFLLRIAESHERVAERVERRLRDAGKSK
jgi:hypothetical protein